MPRRSYDMTTRDQSVASSRKRAVAAAYDLLKQPSATELGLEAVAAKVGVTRATLYNHFGSRAALLLELFAEVGRRAGSDRIYHAMRLPDPAEAAREMLRESTRGLAREQRVIRKLLALTTLDRELARHVAKAERARRSSLQHLAERLTANGCISVPPSEAAALLAALSSFPAFEAFSADAEPELVERRLLETMQKGLGLVTKGE